LVVLPGHSACIGNGGLLAERKWPHGKPNGGGKAPSGLGKVYSTDVAQLINERQADAQSGPSVDILSRVDSIRTNSSNQPSSSEAGRIIPPSDYSQYNLPPIDQDLFDAHPEGDNVPITGAGNSTCYWLARSIAYLVYQNYWWPEWRIGAFGSMSYSSYPIDYIDVIGATFDFNNLYGPWWVWRTNSNYVAGGIYIQYTGARLWIQAGDHYFYDGSHRCAGMPTSARVYTIWPGYF
jgi:hypothetical protein